MRIRSRLVSVDYAELLENKLRRMCQVKAYLPSGTWDRAEKTLDAAEKWERDIREGARILIEEIREERKKSLSEKAAEKWKKEVGDDSPCG